jgi:hypothetical protein
MQPPKTDHFPIVTILNLPTTLVIPKLSCDYKMVEWCEFNEKLFNELAKILPAQQITNEIQLHSTISDLTKAIQNTILDKVPMNKPCPHSKRWWNKKLDDMKKGISKLSNISYKFRALSDHGSHEEYRAAKTEYAEEITRAKEQHWANYLEEVTEDKLWMANKYLSEPSGNGGRTCIPTLKVTLSDGQIQETNSNEEKAKAISKSFFPENPVWIQCRQTTSILNQSIFSPISQESTYAPASQNYHPTRPVVQMKSPMLFCRRW